jgi:sodium pump decarboxylase gamma subunit
MMEMLRQNVILTVFGMATVFTFLFLMIICINLIGKLIRSLGLDKDIQPPKNETPKNTDGAITPEITAAITAAVTEYRKEGRNQHA